MVESLSLPCLLAAAAALAACSSMPSSDAATGAMQRSSPRSTFSQEGLPAVIQVPSGNKVAMETVGVGEITYQCREKQGMAGQFEWFFVGPKAVLNDRAGKRVGSYYGPPATWESTDGSKLTATQVAVAPAATGNIAHQLVKASPAMGQGAMNGVSYVQRVATRGGVPPAATCSASNVGRSETVDYQADYIFWSTM